jgi:cytochrome oxidase Cu insertion factor (SCO1/SenC/PrrC family)
MMRWLATALIAALFALNLWLPHSPLGRRGNERSVRAHVPALPGLVGQKLPDFAFEDLDGRPAHTVDLRGHPLLLVFERSVDW